MTIKSTVLTTGAKILHLLPQNDFKLTEKCDLTVTTPEYQQGRLQHGGEGGKICPFEIRHLGILSVFYLQPMLPKLSFPASWEFQYQKYFSGPNHGRPFH